MKSVSITGPAYFYGTYVGLANNDEIYSWIADHAPATIANCSTLSMNKYVKQQLTPGPMLFTATWTFPDRDTAMLFKLTFA